MQPTGWLVTAHGWRVTATMFGKLQHTGWVNINGGIAAGQEKS
jgi:hypothetical protein